MKLTGNVLITGSGFLARGIVRRATLENWDCEITILSRDVTKHHHMQIEFPKCRYIVGDICDLNGLSKAFVGHDLVIHAAAMKHIPEGELNVRETMRVNVTGSDNVARAAIEARVSKVIGISTDKVCHAVNVYGASKFLMERLFQEYDRMNLTHFSLCRYGNVLSSTGSVLNVWAEMLKRDGYVTATDPDMSRFWLTVNDAVDLILKSLDEPHGTITIPKCKSLDMRTFAHYTMPDAEFRYTGLRPGEKRYEELLTKEEASRTISTHRHFRLYPVTQKDFVKTVRTEFENGYTSDNCLKLTAGELAEMLK